MNNEMTSGVGMTSKRTRERLVQRLHEKGIQNSELLSLIRDTPRHLFVDEALAHRAYEEETTLPIGHQQTLSQPYIVARMTELLLSKPDIKTVLEIGTGSGYQTAILAQLFPKIYTIERIEALHDKARKIIGNLGLRNVQFIHSDGNTGWPQQSRKLQFDAIISTAAPMSVPRALLDQLAPNGILVIPVGPRDRQELQLITRQGDSNTFDTDVIEPVKFVTLLAGIN